MHRSTVAILAGGLWFVWQSPAAVVNANPSNYKTLLRTLKPGDTLNLLAGTYRRLDIVNLNGVPDAWITITGPSADSPAVILGERESNTVEIVNSSYVSIENLRIDSRGIPGCFGVSASSHEENLTHHIRLEGNTFVGQNGGQQTDAISTKTPTWGWIIRYNQILGAGTGLYLGESDGTQPFVSGLIEHNLIRDTIGYNMQIKDQKYIPSIPGMPLTSTTTVIRDNVFIKNDQPSPEGDRPNLLVGAFPATGPGALSMYEIYGNLFLHNPREALFQGSGRVSLHDNIFVDGPARYPAVVLRQQNGNPLKIAYFYHNTVYTLGPGISVGTRAIIDDAVVGNLIFALTPVSGQILRQSNNIVDFTANAGKYVNEPSLNPDDMDFYPAPGKCWGVATDMRPFHTDDDYTRDFNGASKTAAKGAVVFYGAYAGEGTNPGWKLHAGIKPPRVPSPAAAPTIVWISPAAGHRGAKAELTITGAGFSPKSAVAVDGAGVTAGSIDFRDPTEIAVTLTIAANAEPGGRRITVQDAFGSSNAMRFQVNSGAAAPVKRPPGK